MPKIKLTKSNVEQLPLASKGRVTYYDTELKGLALRVSGTSKVYYTCKWNVSKRNNEWVKLGDCRDITPQIARALAGAELRKASERAETAPEVGGAHTGLELVTIYLADHASQKRDAGADDRLKLETHFVPKFGGREVTSITRKEIVDVLLAIPGKGHSDHVRACLSTMFNFAVGIAWIETSPVLGTKRRHKKRKIDRVLDRKEIPIFLRSLDTIDHPILAPLLRLKFLTLARRSEICLMEWSEVDFGDATWIIPGKRTKNGRRFLIPLSKTALTILEQQKLVTGSDPCVWTYDKPSRADKRGPIGPDYLTQEFRRHVARLTRGSMSDSKPFTPHDLRRTGATWIAGIMKRGDVAPILLNHTDSSATGHYDWSEYIDLKKEALNIWDERLIAFAAE